MKPTIIGIGAQKCASSWVHAILGAHPQIGVSDPKELDFFSYYFDHGYPWYESHFTSLSGVDVRCETSPSYFFDPRAPERARAYKDDLKVIAIVRDPVARAYSNHLHEIIKGHIPPLTFEDGLAGNPTYIEQGKYHTHLKRWFEAFGSNQIMVLLAEEISADPTGIAKQLYSFVGVESGFTSAISSEVRNVSDRARSPAIRQGLRSMGSLMRRAGFEEGLTKIKSVPPVASLLRANSVDIRRDIPPMKTVTRRMLDEIFASELIPLASLLERNSLPWPTWDAMTERSQSHSVAS